MRFPRTHLASLLRVAAAFLALASLKAAPVPVPGFSFEGPSTGYVSININSWQKADKPPGYVEDGGFLWGQLMGIFKNTPAGSSDHIENCNGNQALWLFAVPGVAIFQDYESTDWQNSVPSHAFDGVYELGKSYDLNVGINGGGGGMYEGVSLEISLYYRDAEGAKITIAATTITNTVEDFPDHTHLVDFRAHLPVVKPGDAWAGKHIGIQLRSVVSDELQGGYWDVDNVRLTSTTEPPFAVATTRSGSDLRLAWPSASGYTYQMETTTSLLGPWVPYGSPIAGTGSELVTLAPLSSGPAAFFRVQVAQTP